MKKMGLVIKWARGGENEVFELVLRFELWVRMSRMHERRLRCKKTSKERQREGSKGVFNARVSDDENAREKENQRRFELERGGEESNERLMFLSLSLPLVSSSLRSFFELQPTSTACACAFARLRSSGKRAQARTGDGAAVAEGGRC